MEEKGTRCVLFSPIGISDPVKDNRDSAMLHILRYYRPEKAVLFLTKAIVDIHRKDDRYCRMAKAVLPEVELTVLEHEEIVQANRFEQFDKPFRQALEELHRQYPDHQILVNISSGTPQMEASLYLLSATLPFSVTPIQVSTPAKGPNYGKDGKVQTFSTVEQELAGLLETGSEAENRTQALQLENVRAAIIRANVQTLIGRYDYQAALTLIGSAPELFTSKAKTLCEAALRRITLQGEMARNLTEQAGCPAGKLFPLLGNPLESIYEYILMLDSLLERKAYGDYARAISPAITGIMEQVVSYYLKWDVHELCYKNTDDVWILGADEMRAKEPNLLAFLSNRGPYRDSPLNAFYLLSILRYLRKWSADFSTLRNFESRVRNFAAHQIAAVDSDMIQKRCGKLPQDIQEILHRQFLKICNQDVKSKLDWKAYQNMNLRMSEELNRVP